jgi:hypothetical protein
LDEANVYGYKTLIDWYLSHRKCDEGSPSKEMLEVEFVELEKRMKGTERPDPEDE